MVDAARVESKVLVIESNPEIFPVTKLFCTEMNLLGFAVQPHHAMEVLATKVDLGAILLAESLDGDVHGGIALARKIHAARPELPIFLRREHSETLDDLDEATQKIFCTAYTIGSMFHLRRQVDDHIFSFIYPNVLVRGIREITEQVLANQFAPAQVECDTPYVVRDRIVMGELFSLIPIESHWCRGYMMLQGTDNETLSAPGSPTLSERMGEMTNLVWGAFKNRFIADNQQRHSIQTQIPLLIKLNKKYISFGSDDPQLCFKYTVRSEATGSAEPLVLYQRFIFNLNWSPDDFHEAVTSTQDLVASGELELF